MCVADPRDPAKTERTVLSIKLRRYSKTRLRGVDQDPASSAQQPLGEWSSLIFRHRPPVTQKARKHTDFGVLKSASLLLRMLLTLPQETLNDIVAHLHREERALQSLSLVHRRLTEECRRYIFSSIRIDSTEKLHRWSDTIYLGKHGMSRYVRLLDISGEFLSTPDCLLVHLVHLRSFTQLEHLGIRRLDLTKFSGQELARCFGHFPTVHSINVEISGSRQSIHNFLALFPLLRTTVISSRDIGGEDPSTDFPGFVCRGDLVLKACTIDSKANFLSCVTRPTTCYRRFGIDLVTVYDFSPLEQFFETCGSSLESVQFTNFTICECFRHPL